MRLKEIHIKEEATAGATASGNIATVVNPHVANPSRKSKAYTGTPGVSGKGPVKQVKGGTYNTGKNALDMDVKLLSSKEPQMLRRQIQEGSLYMINEEQLNELWPAIAIGAGLVGAGVYGAKKLGKWMKKQQAAPSRTDAAIQQATDGMYSQNPKKKKTTEDSWGRNKRAGGLDTHTDSWGRLKKSDHAFSTGPGKRGRGYNDKYQWSGATDLTNLDPETQAIDAMDYSDSYDAGKAGDVDVSITPAGNRAFDKAMRKRSKWVDPAIDHRKKT